MASRKLPAVQLAEPVDIKQLARQVETELNDIIVRLNEDTLGGNLDGRDHQVKNIQRPTEGHDAVNLDTLRESLNSLRNEFIKLNRPRRPGAVPGAFREFRAEHLQRHPEALCADAEPYIRVLVKLPVQANKGNGLTDELVLKRNTDHVKLQADWTTLTSTMTIGGTDMSVADPTYIKSNTLYLIDSEYVRTGTASGANPILIDRAQEGSEETAHDGTATVKWASILPKEGFAGDENGILGATFEIDNSERVAERVFEGWSVNEDGIDGVISTYTLTLNPGHNITDLAADPRFGEVIISWSELGGDTYRYQIFKAINGTATAGNASQFYREIPTDGTGVTFWTDPLPRPGDANPAMGTWSDTFHYAVQAINILCQAGTADTVGPLQGDASTTNPASDVTGISATEGPACSADGSTMSEITASWSGQPADVDKVRIYWLKDGDTNPSLVAAAEASPVKFTVPTIDPSENQTVTLYFVSVSAEGVENGILSSPSTTVDVDGQTSAPTPITGLSCQIVEGGVNLWWDPNIECDLYGYEVADTGDIAAANQSHITDAHVIGFVATTPESTIKPHFFFKETLYEGSSNGTTVTLSEDVLKTDQLLVNSVGRNVQFVGDYSGTINPSVQAVSNTENSITFAASSIPNGNVKFFLRGSGGEHHFWVRPINHSSQKAEWRPEPPAMLECSPLAPDGTRDTGVPTVVTINNDNTFSSWTLGRLASGSLLFAAEDRPGHIYVNAVAEAESSGATGVWGDQAAPNIEGITEWEVTVDINGDDDEIISIPADSADDQYFKGFYPGLPSTLYWRLRNKIWIPLPNVGIDSVSLRAKNWFGWSEKVALIGNGMAGGANPWYTADLGQLKKAEAETASLNVVYPNLAKSTYFTMTLGTATQTVGEAEYRDSGTTKGSGDSVRTGETFTVIVSQDATGGRSIAWDSKYIFPNTAWKNPDPRPNKRTVFQFYILDSSNFLLASPPVGGV